MKTTKLTQGRNGRNPAATHVVRHVAERIRRLARADRAGLGPIAAVLACGFAMASASVAVGQEIVPSSEESGAADAVLFSRDIRPAFQKNCLPCHNTTRAKSGVNLETVDQIMRGGDSGSILVPGQADESLLFQVAAHQSDPVMPPESNKVNARRLNETELALLRRWIDQGAPDDHGGLLETPALWRPLPEKVQPIYSAVISPDETLIACSRGNRILLYDTNSGAPLADLNDADLPATADGKSVAHLDLVQSMAFSPDGSTLASGGYRTVKIWRRPEVSHVVSFGGVPPDVTVFLGSPDNAWVAAGTGDGQVLLWRADNAGLFGRWKAHDGAVSALRFSPDSSHVLSASADGSVALWELAEAREAGRVRVDGSITRMALNRDGAWLVTGDDAGRLTAWSLPDAWRHSPDEPAAPAWSVKFHEHPVAALEFDPDPMRKNRLASGATDGSVRVLQPFPIDQPTASVFARSTPLKLEAPAATIAFVETGEVRVTTAGPDSGGIHTLSGKVTGAEDGAVSGPITFQLNHRVALEVKRMEDHAAAAKQLSDYWTKREAETGKALEKERKSAEESAGALVGLELALADVHGEAEAAARMAATEAARLSAAEARVERLKRIQKTVESKPQGDAAPGPRLFVGSIADALQNAEQSLAKVKETSAKATKAAEAAGKKLDETRRNVIGAERNSALALRMSQAAAADHLTAVSEKAASVSALEHAQKTLEERRKSAAEAEAADRQFAGGHPAPLGDRVAGMVNGTVHLWRRGSGILDATVPDIEGGWRGCRFIDNGRLLTLSANGDSMDLWEIPGSWTLAKTIGGPNDTESMAGRVAALAFSPDGSVLVTGSGDPSRSGQLKLWDIDTGELLREISDAHSDTILSAAFSPNGKLIVTGSADRFMKVFQVSDGSFVRGFEGHTHHVLDVAWRADGLLLASAGADQSVKLWDFHSGAQKKSISGFEQEVTAVRFVGLGESVLAASGDGTVRIDDNQLEGVGSFIHTASISPSGHLLIAGGEDGVLRVWDKGAKAPRHRLSRGGLNPVSLRRD